MGKLFIETKDSENNSRIHKTLEKWLYYAEGYKIAAELIENKLLENPEKQDFLIYPLVYTYRHYIELKLKEIIVEGHGILSKTKDFQKENHDLIKLWIEFQRTMKLVYKDEYQAPPPTIEKKIKELHDTDKNSDGFRYPINQKGKQNLENLKIINFRNFKDEVLEVKRYLEAIADSFYAIKDANLIIQES
jgi:hypothetical protein